MIPIHTQRGKLYGMLDTGNYILHIKDGKDKRLIRVPQEGLKLIYVTENNRK